MKNNKGFTYIEILISMAALFLCLSFFSQLMQYNYKLRGRADEINKVNMIAQGVMDGYKTLGKEQALTLAEGYTVDITEDTNTGHASLKKVTVTITPKVTGVSNVTLVSYYSQ